MRFISIWKHEKTNVVPGPEHVAAMGKLIEAGMKEGWLLATEGIGPNARPLRVRSKRGSVSVTDGPFAEAKEVIGGYALMRAGSRDEVIELCKRFLEVAGDGECEVVELYETPALAENQR